MNKEEGETDKTCRVKEMRESGIDHRKRKRFQSRRPLPSIQLWRVECGWLIPLRITEPYGRVLYSSSSSSFSFLRRQSSLTNRHKTLSFRLLYFFFIFFSLFLFSHFLHRDTHTRRAHAPDRELPPPLFFSQEGMCETKRWSIQSAHTH